VRDNELDGECVVNDLLEWRDLWHSVLPARFPSSFRDRNEKEYHPWTELSMLRCVRWDSWPADALYIWTSVEILPELRRRVEERWKADELVVISPERDEEMHLANIDNEDDRVLYVWWDEQGSVSALSPAHLRGVESSLQGRFPHADLSGLCAAVVSSCELEWALRRAPKR